MWVSLSLLWFSRMQPRQLSKPRRTGFKMHQTPPIVEPSHTLTSHSQQTPRPAAPPQSAGILVVYDIVDMSAPQDTKRTPFIKKHSSSAVSLGEFKDKIFNRKGEYRCVSWSFCVMYGVPTAEKRES